MFKFFKKDKTPAYDPTNITVHDIKLGFIFEYDLRQWEVIEEYTYDWGDEFFSKEYKVTDGTETRFLGVEEDDELELLWMEKLRLSALEIDLAHEISNYDRPPKSIVHEGKTFYREEETPGYFQVTGSGTWKEFISWDYYDKSEEFVLSIEQWEERSFDVSFGKTLESYEISNIIPA